ncbi:MAG TPA: adenosine deaminase [Caldilineae bacterium]|nr:adenosine deaminase [Caldilineae bacterium]HIQ11631.1 adenosine deaminase [Caldilineales bacterium]
MTSRQQLHRFAEAMPKVELHLHLEGSITPETALALARRHSVSLPADDPAGLQAWFRFRDFHHFIQVYLTLSDLLRTPDDFAFIVVAMARELARQNVRYAEITFTAYTHLWQGKGLTPDDLIAGLDAGRAEARDRFGVKLAWIIDIPRNLSFDKQTRRYTGAASDPTVEMALAWRERGVVALGLGGYEIGAPPEPFAHAFERARAGGLHSAPHAGEHVGPEGVWGAIQALGAERIGHGVRAIEDPDLMNYLVEHQIPLEINLTSNIRLGVYPDFASHPLPRFWDAGVYVTVNSDDPPLFNTTLNQEYRVLVDAFGFDADDLMQVSLNALRASFLSEMEKAEMEQAFLQEFAELFRE